VVLRDTLVSWMEAHQERMMACPGKTEATVLGANSAELRVRSGAYRGPQGTCSSETCRGSEEAAQGPASSSRATQRAKGTDPRKLWIPDETDRCAQRDDPPCRSGIAQGTRSSGQFCKKNP
jgi:hypothetical protein